MNERPTSPPESDPDLKATLAFEAAIAREGEWRARLTALRARIQQETSNETSRIVDTRSAVGACET